MDEEQLRRRLVASGTTLLGLVQHLTDGERYWFGYTLAGDLRYADVDFDMVVAPDRSADQVIAGYWTAIAESDARIRAADGLDVRTAHPVAEDVHPPGRHLQDEQHMQTLEEDGVHSEQITRQQALGLGTQERAPGGVQAAGAGR